MIPVDLAERLDDGKLGHADELGEKHVAARGQEVVALDHLHSNQYEAGISVRASV